MAAAVAEQVLKKYGIRTRLMPGATDQSRVMMARERMIILYDQSEDFHALVIGTSNKTEALLGYTTQFGDNAAAIQPITDLYKCQVRQMARAVGVPPNTYYMFERGLFPSLLAAGEPVYGYAADKTMVQIEAVSELLAHGLKYLYPLVHYFRTDPVSR